MTSRIPSSLIPDAAQLQRRTRLLFAALGALLGPLVPQALFGPDVEPRAWLAVLVLTPAFAQALATCVSPAIASPRAVGAQIAGLSVLAGMANGLTCALVWTASVPDRDPPAVVAATVSGAALGSLAGCAFGLVFALWGYRARLLIGQPSVLGALRLRIGQGLLLGLAGLAGASLYTVGLLQAASIAGLGLGLTMILEATIGAMRLERPVEALLQGTARDLLIVPRPPHVQAPALAWSESLDRMVVRAAAPLTVAPFREELRPEPVALLPHDDTSLPRALAQTTVRGVLAVLALATLGMFTALQPAADRPDFVPRPAVFFCD